MTAAYCSESLLMFKGIVLSHLQDKRIYNNLMMKALTYTETLVDFY